MACNAEVLKQLWTVAIVAFCVSLFEVIFFYVLVMPKAMDAMYWMMREAPDVVDTVPVPLRPAVAALDAVLAVADERERPLTQANNRATVVYGTRPSGAAAWWRH